MITEHLMRPGNGSARFVPDVPVRVTDLIVNAMEGAGGPGCHLVVSPVRFDPVDVTVAQGLAGAAYTGRITKRPSRLSVEVEGILAWLNTSHTAAINRTSGTPSQWIGDLAANGLTAGTVTNTGATSVTRNFPAYVASRREMLDAVAAAGSWEYRVRPDFKIDAAIPTTLFASHTNPTLVVTRKEEGPSGRFRGVEGGLLDQGLDDSQLRTRVTVLAEGGGSTIAVGQATQTLALKTWDGSTPTLAEVVSSPVTPSASAAAIAQATLNLRGARRQVTVSSRTFALHRFARPGDYVWLYDPASGLVDPTNQIDYRGETIGPAKVRLLSWTWPIEAGLGVYLLLNGATPRLVDVTPWIQWETGDTMWTVGDWNPPSYGRVNRSNPEVELRITGPDS